MAEFKMEIAGQAAAVTSLFESIRDYCRAYHTEKEADFSIATSWEDIAFEREQSYEEARIEGFRIRHFTEPYLERLSIQRKFAEYLLDFDTLLFHGSVVAVDGEGYLFTARSGTGKSTHTRFWRQVFPGRAVMVNDDKPFLRITKNGVLACGSPWSGKHGLDTNITVPLKGICILERGKENRIRPIHADEAMSMLIKQSYQPLEQSRLPKCLSLVDMLAENVALWHMECNKDPHAAVVSYEAMSGKQVTTK